MHKAMALLQRSRPVLFMGMAYLAVMCNAASAASAVRIEFQGPIVEVVRWKTERCEDVDIPDTALRAFRRYDNAIIGVASHYVNYALIGSDLAQMSKNGCNAVFRSPKNPDPARFDDQTWLAATWTDDGMSIAAIGHHEYHAEMHPGMCAGKTPRECRYGVLSLFKSSNGGETFFHANQRPIAAVSVPQTFNQSRDTGYFQPSNIMEWEGMKYVFVRTSGGGLQTPATCLMRAKDPQEPGAWEIYDGKEFRPSLFDPYKDQADRDPVCAQIPGLNGMAWGVLRHRQRGVFIVLMVVNEPGIKTLRLATSVSKDLMHWPKPQLVEGIKFEWSGECGDGPVYHYPSLIDPDAPGRNFDTTDDDALLFLTAINRKDCKMSLDRDLVFRRVHLEFE